VWSTTPILTIEGDSYRRRIAEAKRKPAAVVIRVESAASRNFPRVAAVHHARP